MHQAAGEAAITLRVALSMVSGAAGLAIVRRKLGVDYARQSAATALASGLLHANRDCLKVLATDGKMLRASEHGAMLMEAESPEQLSGAGLLPETAPAKSFSAAVRSSPVQNASQSGRTRWWNSTLTPVTGDDGAVSALLCASEDVTQQSELLKTLITSAPSAARQRPT
ncbi:hypothetical protein OKW41_003023 [Paraburkholderia sp. UCT70]